MKRNEIDLYLRKLLNSDSIQDESLNGLQVEGKEEIEKIGFAVSASEETFLKAKRFGCDAVIVHHGLLWKNKGVEAIAQVLKKRLYILLKNEINLFAFHLPLDCHPQLGNNARAALDLSLGNIKPFCEYHGTMIGYKGNFLEPVFLKDFLKKVEEYYNHKALLLPFGKKEIRSVGIVSGGAPYEVKQAAAEGLDLYITGESVEGAYYLAKELEINMACLGHYATERVGVLALRNHIES
ncbi:MAG: Nif3-like dinuclear metal center hexameric protein, partial [Acidobacteria bacterium]|nr:Nif3-like dinuclear metal center hexameric protein [Acidobacteriota bacterium]